MGAVLGMKRLSLLFVFALAASALGSGTEGAGVPEVRKAEWLTTLEAVKSPSPATRLRAARDLQAKIAKSREDLDEAIRTFKAGSDESTIRAYLSAWVEVYDLPELRRIGSLETAEEILDAVNAPTDPTCARAALVRALGKDWKTEDIAPIVEGSDEWELRDDFPSLCGTRPQGDLYTAVAQGQPATYLRFMKEAGLSARWTLLRYYEGPWGPIEPYVLDWVNRREDCAEAIYMLAEHPSNAAEPLIRRRLNSPLAPTRLAAISALAKADREAAWRLIPPAFLYDPAEGLRSYVDLNLLDLTDSRAVPFIRTGLLSPYRESIRRVIDLAIDSKLPALVAEIVAYVSDPVSSERKYALQRLAFSTSSEARILFESMPDGARAYDLKVWCDWAVSQSDIRRLPRLLELSKSNDDSLAGYARKSAVLLLLGLSRSEGACGE